MELKGGKLLDKIRSLHGSINLLTYRGNLREVAVECGYIRKDRIQRKDINDEKFFHFCKSYWRALLDAPESNRWNPKRFNRLREKLQLKYKHFPTKEEREEIERKAAIRKAYREKNPPIKQGKVKQIFDESIKENYEQEVLTKRATTKSGLLMYDKLTGTKLLNEVLKLRHFGKKETSICIITGYEVSNIGVFRRQFAKAAGVKLAPLRMMVREMKEKDFLIEPPKEKETQKTLETTEIKEEQEVFINREKISSQVKRLYRNPKFREKILKKHGSICSCCDIAMEKLIEAAHIIPVEDNGNDDVNNGIPLCPTHHTAFDNFLFTINPTDNTIIYREGLSSQDLQITKTKCELKVSKESLEYRYKLFSE